MKYLNQFHKESTERKLKKMEVWEKHSLNSSEEVRKMVEMHKQLKELYSKSKVFQINQ